VIADPDRFPSGIAALADYVHARGLKLGLYTAVGHGTCAMGSDLGLGCENGAIPECSVAKQDLADYVSWGIDHLKVDGCSGTYSTLNASYAIIGELLLHATVQRGGAPVLYNPSCLSFNYPRQFRELAAIGNQWRFTHDITDTWESVQSIIEHIGAGQPVCTPGPLPANCTGWHYSVDGQLKCESFCVERDAFLGVVGQGGWHDPDALLVGNTPCSAAAAKDGMSCKNLTHAEEQTQMALWSMASAPLQMSNDLTAVSQQSKAILQNKAVIAVQQDRLGRIGFRFMNNITTGLQGWKRELVGGDVAVALVNMGGTNTPPQAWNHTVGGYAEACGGDKGNLWCGDFGSVEAAKERCSLGEAACSGFSIATVATKSGPAWHGCMKTGAACGFATNPDFDGYQKITPAPSTAYNVEFDFNAVGFAPDTFVRVADLFNAKDLGVFKEGKFVSAEGIAPHGVLMLKLVYEPQYKTEL